MQWILQDHSCLLEVSPYVTNIRVHCTTTQYTAYWCCVGNHRCHIRARQLIIHQHITHLNCMSLMYITAWIHFIISVITLPLTDLTLTTDRLMELFQSVEDPDRVDVLDRGIGDSLGLPQSVIAVIKSNFQSTAQRKEAYLDTYTHQHPCPFWEKVAEALLWCNLLQERNEVQNTYIQGKHVVHVYYS